MTAKEKTKIVLAVFGAASGACAVRALCTVHPSLPWIYLSILLAGVVVLLVYLEPE